MLVALAIVSHGGIVKPGGLMWVLLVALDVEDKIKSGRTKRPAERSSSGSHAQVRGIMHIWRRVRFMSVGHSRSDWLFQHDLQAVAWPQRMRLYRAKGPMKLHANKMEHGVVPPPTPAVLRFHPAR